MRAGVPGWRGLALAGRVVKLADSACSGLRGRVPPLQFAVTVVGFPTVRTMATVALTGPDDGARLPEDSWRTSTGVALAAATLAPRFGERPQDALCLGLLARLGVALLHHADPEGHPELTAAEPTAAGLRAAEVRRYGLHASRLSAVGLEHWASHRAWSPRCVRWASPATGTGRCCGRRWRSRPG